jgi:hypothetical protein
MESPDTVAGTGALAAALAGWREISRHDHPSAKTLTKWLRAAMLAPHALGRC